MNGDMGISEGGQNATVPHVSLDIPPPYVSLGVPPPQVIQYLQNLDKRLQEERRREIHERFRNIRCFQHILGISTTFKLIHDKCKF